jgi:hypothetical protein
MAKKTKSNNPVTSSEQAIDRASNGNGDDLQPDPRERIAARAYELYLRRGGGEGRATEDWLEAERELSQPRASRSDR